jgi:hypothetical protein
MGKGAVEADNRGIGGKAGAEHRKSPADQRRIAAAHAEYRNCRSINCTGCI